MLTIKNKFKNTKLETLSKLLIKDDIINFKLGFVGGGFTSVIADRILTKISSDKNRTIVVINDLTLQMVDALLEAGYKLENITLVFGKWNSDGTVNNDTTVYNIMKLFIEHNIEEKINIIKLGELFMGNKYWGSVIANPPYGKIGANITYRIREDIKYDEYVNLLPMVDYEKAKGKNVWNYVDLTTISSCPGAFGEDATISPIICKVTRTKSNSLSADNFRLACLENKLTVKYFKENLARKNTFNILEQFPGNDLTKTIALPLRVKSGNHSGEAKLGKTNKSQFYQINNGLKNTVANEELMSICCTTVTFSTIQEKLNVAKLLYSGIGYKFASWLMTGMNRDAFHLREHSMWFPKVDWTRSWTVEEILTDYGYTETEIQEVMADLVNFKGMED